MADILNFYRADGTTPLGVAERDGITYPHIESDLIYSDQGGASIYEFVIRNYAADERATNLVITSAQKPTDPTEGGLLQDEWSFRPIEGSTYSTPANRLEVAEIPPTGGIRVQWRTTATPDSNTVTHKGLINYNYLRSSV